MKIKKIGDFTIKEYALLCKKYLKKGCKDCPFLILNDGHCISTLMYPAGIPFNNTIERKEKYKKIDTLIKYCYVGFVKNSSDNLALCEITDPHTIFIGSDIRDYIFSKDKDTMEKICYDYNEWRVSNLGIDSKIDFDVKCVKITTIIEKFSKNKEG